MGEKELLVATPEVATQSEQRRRLIESLMARLITYYRESRAYIKDGQFWPDDLSWAARAAKHAQCPDHGSCNEEGYEDCNLIALAEEACRTHLTEPRRPA